MQLLLPSLFFNFIQIADIIITMTTSSINTTPLITEDIIIIIGNSVEVAVEDERTEPVQRN